MRASPTRREATGGRVGLPEARGRAAVATSHPVTVEARLSLLRAGGSAVDAALAAALALMVVEPTSCDLGGDVMARWGRGARAHRERASPRCCSLTALVDARGGALVAVPHDGWWPICVPGAPAGWQLLHERCGRRPRAEVLGPALEAARSGVMLTPMPHGRGSGPRRASLARPGSLGGGGRSRPGVLRPASASEWNCRLTRGCSP